MSLYIAIVISISLLSIALIFYKSSKNFSSSTLSITGIFILGLIGLLLYKVVDLKALTAPSQFSENAAIELSLARSTPSNILAWNDLGRKYLLEKEYLNAYMAFSESQQLDSFVGLGINKQQALEERLKWMTGLAEARILAQGGGIDTESDGLITATLELDPKHPKALWYGGLAAAQQAKYQLAQLRWNKLLAQNPPDALRTVVQNRLDSVNKLLKSNEVQLESDWVFNFRLSVSDKLLATKKTNSRIFASLKQSEIGPPIIAKAYTVAELADKSIYRLEATDGIAGMSQGKRINWQKPVFLSLIWSPSGQAVAEDNIRMLEKISTSNLDRVFEFTLE